MTQQNYNTAIEHEAFLKFYFIVIVYDTTVMSMNSTCVLWEDGFNSYSVIRWCKNLGWVPEVDAFLCSHTY